MDTISNMIITLKNAGAVGRESVLLPYSKLKEAVAKTLEKEGYLKSVEVKEVKGKKSLAIGLLFDGRMPKITGVQRISKPSKRIYRKAAEMRPVKNGYGALIVSTSNGVMTGRDAKKASLGGEALFSIW